MESQSAVYYVLPGRALPTTAAPPGPARCFSYRDDGSNCNWYCLICGKWADGDHLVSRLHRRRAPECEYWRQHNCRAWNVNADTLAPVATAPQQPVRHTEEATTSRAPLADPLVEGFAPSAEAATAEIRRILLVPADRILFGRNRLECLQAYRRSLLLIHPDRGYAEDNGDTAVALNRLFAAKEVIRSSTTLTPQA